MDGIRNGVLRNLLNDCIMHTFLLALLQIQESDVPGVMKVWALIGTDLHQLKLIVPRTFYVNCRSPKTISGEGISEYCIIQYTPINAPPPNLVLVCM